MYWDMDNGMEVGYELTKHTLDEVAIPISQAIHVIA